MMDTVTVQGVGTVRAQADYLAMTLTIREVNADYDLALAAALRRVEDMKRALAKIQAADSLKLLQYDVEMDPQGQQDCFCCIYQFRLAFDFDHSRLSAILGALIQSGAAPRMQLDFTVKDSTWLQRQMLYNAAANAKEKAEILCRATSNRLGRLLEIRAETDAQDQSRFISKTKTNFNRAIARRSAIAPQMLESVQPEEIEESETITFTWEIL